MRRDSRWKTAGAAAASIWFGGLGCAGAARADWSIVLVDTRTGEVAVGSATCGLNFDVKASSLVLVPEVGAGFVRSAADLYFQDRTFVRDRLLEGQSPDEVLAGLAQFQTRYHSLTQYGVGSVNGPAGSHTGAAANVPQWRGASAGEFESEYAGQIGAVRYTIQGFGLTGEPVVLSAVEAAISTPTDLPGRLMAAMEAATAMGGDGACSCTSGGPTSCGSPPEKFTRGSHAAAMLVGRAGDGVATTAGYKLNPVSPLFPMWTSAGDVNNDGKPELAVSSSGRVHLFLNTTPASSAVPIFAPEATILSGTSQSFSWCGVAEVTGDGHVDVIALNNIAQSQLSVYPGNGDGTFGARQDFPVVIDARTAVVGDFDGVNGLDVAAAGGGVAVMLSNGSGGFSRTDLAIGGRGIATGDLDGDGDLDLAVGATGAPGTTRMALFMNDGHGVFSAGAVVPIAAQSYDNARVRTGDFDGDGDVDIVATFTGAMLYFLNSGGPAPTFTRMDIAPAPSVNGAAVGDLDHDGFDDVYLNVGARDVALYRGGPAGLTFDRSYSHWVGSPFGNFANSTLVDLDGDGDLDSAMGWTASLGNSAFVVPNLGAAQGYRFVDGVGAAPEDLFANFNVALQGASDPDGVAQLREQFDPWRQALVGRPDAVQSLTHAPSRMSAGDPSARTLTFTLRDWQGLAITSKVATPTVTALPGSAGATTAGTVVDLGGGAYSVELIATGVVGVDRYEIRVDDGIRPVILMPRTSVEVVACPSDINGDGVVNSTDVSDFINLWFEDQAGGTVVADYNGDGVVNSTDVSDMINAWFVDLAAGLCV